MPVRKTTRKKTTRQLDPHELVRQERIDCLVQEAENAFEQYKKDISADIETLKEKIKEELNSHLRILPVYLKNMTVGEAMEKNIDFKSIVVAKNQRVDTTSILSKFMKKNNTGVKQIAKEPISMSKKKPLSAGKRRSVMLKKSRASTARRSRILPSQPHQSRPSADNANDSYEDISDDEVFFTPSHQPKRRLGPITPKFDTSKPIPRTQLRRARPGELAVSLSGSPLLYEAPRKTPRTHSEKIQVTVGKKVYHFSEPDTLKGKPRINERKQIAELQKKLDQILKK